LLTTVAFKWLISEKIPNLPYDTYLDDYSQWGFYVQVTIMIANGSMLFVRQHDDLGDIDVDVLQIYDYICFGIIFSIWLGYQIYAYFVRVPRIKDKESLRLKGMTEAKFERVDAQTLARMTSKTKTNYKRQTKISNRLGSPRSRSRSRSRSSRSPRSLFSRRSDSEEIEESEKYQSVVNSAILNVPDRPYDSSF